MLSAGAYSSDQRRGEEGFGSPIPPLAVVLDLGPEAEERYVDALVPVGSPLLDGQVVTRGSVVNGSAAQVPVEWPRTSAGHRHPDHRGLITVIRQGSPAEPLVQRLHFTPDVPQRPKDPVAIPWATLIPSVVGGLVISLLFSSLFAILAGVTAMSLLGRSLASRLQYRHKTNKRTEALDLAEHLVGQARNSWVRSETDRRRSLGAMPDASALKRGAMPWTYRLVGDSPALLRIGVGDLVVMPELEAGSLGEAGSWGRALPELATAAMAPCVLDTVPISVPIDRAAGLAICGDRQPQLGLIRSSLLHLLVMHGPADLGLIILTTEDRLPDWDWVKWLPALVGTAVSPGEIDQLLSRGVESPVQPTLPGRDPGEDPGGERRMLVVVDGPEPVGPGALARLFSGRSERAILLWLGGENEVPAGCANQISVFSDRSFLCWDLRVLDQTPQSGVATMFDLAEATSLARLLAPFDDPELEQAETNLPDQITHELLFGLERDAEGKVSEAAWTTLLRSYWQRADRTRLRLPIGLSRDGALVLDLVEDGPHVLVAGTTGSGKSELLRSMVVGASFCQPPEQLSFVLIDFKGGGAFDLVAELPHVAAVVTDLDGVQAGRALQSLRAELRHREERLRHDSCSNIGELGSLEDPMPRLVIMVDEFAALAEELPEFLDGLIDVARRGRSLGVHLVLATQRPAGVVTGQIRANTNLRICLRVQDQSDSMDVIESADAARLPSIPGRAILRRGGEPLDIFQCCRVALGSLTQTEPFVLHPRMSGRQVTETEATDRASGTDGSGEGPLAQMVRACGKLSSHINLAPWLDPIGEVSLVEVGDRLAADGSATGCPTVPLGWLDDPSHRARKPLGWDPSRGGLAIIGSDGNEVEATTLVAVVGLVNSQASHVYVLDGSGGHLRDWEQASAVGAVVTPADPERMHKLVMMLAQRLATETAKQMSTKAEQTAQASGPTVGLVVHRWAAVVDGLESMGGPGAASLLHRLVRDGGNQGLALILTGASDREIPARVMAGIDQRLIHRLADPSGYLTFGMGDLGRVGPTWESSSSGLEGAGFADPGSGLLGVAGRVGGLAATGSDQSWTHLSPQGFPSWEPAPGVEVLGSRVGRDELPRAILSGSSLVAPIGLSLDLEPVSVRLGKGQVVMVLGQPGSGRTTTIETIVGQLVGNGAADLAIKVDVLDNAETMTMEEGQARLADAKEEGLAVVIGATPGSVRGMGSWLAPLMSDAAVILINPSRADGEACRTLVPDLVDAAKGRAVVLDRGRSTTVQLAA